MEGAAVDTYIYVVQMDIPAEKEADFNRVYDTQHIPALLNVPGVRSAKRYMLQSANVDGVARYLAIYELDSSDIPDSRAWLEAAEIGEWVTQIRPHTTNRSHLTFQQLA
jgi:hypothetical protein